MRISFIYAWMMLALCAALTPANAFAGKEPYAAVEAGQTVLLLDVIESKPFHRESGGWIANSLDGDDELVGAIRARLSEVLTDAGYKTAWETVPEQFVRPFQRWSYLSIGWSGNKVKPKYLPWFREQMQKHGATSVVIFYTTYDHSYGVITPSGEPPAHAYLVANVGAVALHGDALDAHSYSAGRICRIRIDFSSLGVESSDQITGSHLVPFNGMIASLAARNAAEYLADTGLYGIRNPACFGADG